VASAIDLAVLLASRAAGTKLWLRAVGRSMFPLFLSGDDLHVERCDEGSLVPGDVAVFASARGDVIAHLVKAVSPLNTSSYTGVEDQAPGRVLGRVVAVRRWGRAVSPPRWAVLLGHRLLVSPAVRRAVRLTVSTVIALTQPARDALFRGAEVRMLLPAEALRAVELACGVRGGSVAGEVRSAAERSQVAVATAGDRWLGVAWKAGLGVDCAVVSWAQQLGLEAALERALS
jgi:hypothetical protein